MERMEGWAATTAKLRQDYRRAVEARADYRRQVANPLPNVDHVLMEHVSVTRLRLAVDGKTSAEWMNACFAAAHLPRN